MIELDFLVTPELQVGAEHSIVDVRIAASPTVFPDHDDFVTIQLWSHDRRPVMLGEEVRVAGNEHAVDEALRRLARRRAEEAERHAAAAWPHRLCQWPLSAPWRGGRAYRRPRFAVGRGGL